MSEKRKRRWFQFSLRTLLVVVLLVSIGMSWLGGVWRQREAVEVIEKAGGSVFYDYDDHWAFNETREPSVPEWMVDVFGGDLFFDVSTVILSETEFGDDEMAYLKRLTNLTRLDLLGPQITDAGPEHLEGLTNLAHLDLCDTQVTAEAVESLRQALPDCDVDY